jgi:hypothetical protein
MYLRVARKDLMYDHFAKVDGIAKSVRLKSVEHLSTIIPNHMPEKNLAIK